MANMNNTGGILPPITVYKFNFYLRAEESLTLPEFKGSMFRGAFGITFRRLVCCTGLHACGGCLNTKECSYFSIFETEMEPNSIPYLKGVKKVPHPFVIMPPADTQRNYKKGAMLKIGLVLFGAVINYFPYFVYVFKHLGNNGIGYKRSWVSLARVTNEFTGGNEVDLYNPATGDLTLKYLPFTNEQNSYNLAFNKEVTLSFLTPVRLQELGTVLWKSDQVTPTILLDGLIRRYISIAHLFCNASAGQINIPKQDYSGICISKNTLSFDKMSRYSNRQGKKVPMDGFRGSVSMTGELKQFLPIIKLGELLHIGKNTVFGMGRYKMLMD